MNVFILNAALDDFIKVAALARHPLERQELEAEFLAAPHNPKSLPSNKMAVYGFWDKGKCLKVGRVGARSNARFISQHYNPRSAPSTLAASILKDIENWRGRLDDEQNIGNWMKANFTRINVYVDNCHPVELTALLESFFHLRFKPRYER